MPIITLPDGSKKVFEKSVTTLEIAQSIGDGLAKATIAGKVNDVLLDATIPIICLLYTSPSPRDLVLSRMPSSA